MAVALGVGADEHSRRVLPPHGGGLLPLLFGVLVEEVFVVQFFVAELVYHGLTGGGVDLAVTAGDGDCVAGALCVVGVGEVGAFGVGEPVQRCRVGVGAQ